ncbi:hypothetical protein ABMA27_004957 [Loxostege sticticalis]|uniref:Uncharacterized protein n=1 Tax=Loxostege sticticalis TaxID=481309 RepID=A0ABR3HLA3_LOXSC
MEKPESNWKKSGNWKNRYAKVYGAQRVAINRRQQIEDQRRESRRISFMTNDNNTPYTDLLMRVRANRRDSSSTTSPSPRYLTSLLSQQSDSYGTYTGTGSMLSNDLGGHETLLLDMVRAASREFQEAQDQTLDLPRDDVSDDLSTEACVHGMSMRMTERSVSRSRVSRMSTRRDMDIPSILAFTTTTTAPAPVQLEIPAFKMANEPQREEIPRWSIRRAVCPVCSQKWRDKSSISNIKYSAFLDQ